MRTNKSYKGFIVKSTIISMLALSMGTGSAWADEAGTQPTVTADVAVTTGTTEPEQHTPSLLPGDFFYFVKTIYERIQLAFAANDMEEAILLAQFAQERLAETAILFEKGDADIAEVTLKWSLSLQQQAIDSAASVMDPATTDTTAETTEPIVEAEAGVEGAELAENQTPSEEEEGVEPAQADKVKNSLQHNIVALTAALEKVENPQAQSSLLKNITKSFAHLEKKLTKLSERNEEVALTAPVSQETAASTDGNTESTETAETAVEDNDYESVKPRQEKKLSPKKAKEQQHTSEKKAEKQHNKPAKSQGNAGKSESAGNKKEAK